MNTNEWARNNPERWAEHQRKYRNKFPNTCKRCDKEFPRGTGRHFCSDQCAKEHRLEASRKASREAHKEFIKYKESLGCSKCGYSECGACLDYHHLDPKEKEFRISAKLWRGQSSRVKAEIDKCILVCKNCHYMIHYKERQENNDEH